MERTIEMLSAFRFESNSHTRYWTASDLCQVRGAGE